MNIKRTSPLMQFYLTANKGYPKDFCTLFWGCVKALLFSPFSLLGLPILLWKKEVRKHGLSEMTGQEMLSRGLAVFLVIYSIIIGGVVFANADSGVWVFLACGVAYLVGGGIVVSLFIAAVKFIGERLPDKLKRNGKRAISKKKKKPSVISAWIKDYKGKHCSMLTVKE